MSVYILFCMTITSRFAMSAPISVSYRHIILLVLIEVVIGADVSVDITFL